MLDPSDVAAVLVTRGDVNLQPIIDTLPYGETVVWNNAERLQDWKLFGRYMGILETRKPVIYVQDDDCLISNHAQLLAEYEPGVVTANFRDDPPRVRAFHDSTLIGWGALFDRDLPWLAFMRLARFYPFTWDTMTGLGAEFSFPILTPSKKLLVDPEWLEEDGQMVFGRSNRMSRQDGFYEEMRMAQKRARNVRGILGLDVDARVVARQEAAA